MPSIRVYTSEPCGYCARAKRLLADKGVPFEEVRLDRWDFEARQDLVRLTGRFTVPQVVVDDRPIGGYDDLVALDGRGALDPLLGVSKA